MSIPVTPTVSAVFVGRLLMASFLMFYFCSVNKTSLWKVFDPQPNWCLRH